MTTMIFIGSYAFIFIFNLAYMDIKEKKLYLNFDKKLKDKGYEKTNDSNSFSLIVDEVVNHNKYAARILLSLFPVTNLYPFVEIITKKLEKEYSTILSSLDNKELLDSLEKDGYIYNQNTILKGKEKIVRKIDEMSKSYEPNVSTNKYIEIKEFDSLENLKEKRALLDEMIYLKNLEEMNKVSYEEAKEKPFELTRALNKNQKFD